MIAKGEDVIVFAKGTIESPIITRIVKIKSVNFDVIEDTRSDIYETERAGIPSKIGDFLQIYAAVDFVGGGDRRGDRYQNARNNNRLGVKRSRSEITANPVVKSEVNEDDGTVTVTYKNGDVELESVNYRHTSGVIERKDVIKNISNRDIEIST
jgi:hypothetical protein